MNIKNKARTMDANSRKQAIKVMFLVEKRLLLLIKAKICGSVKYGVYVNLDQKNGNIADAR